MSSSGPPPATPTFEASKCALIMARAVASVIENPPGTDAAWLVGAVRAAATSPSCFFGAATVSAEAARTRPWRDPTPTRERCKIVPAAPTGGRTTGPAAAAGQTRRRSVRALDRLPRWARASVLGGRRLAIEVGENR